MRRLAWIFAARIGDKYQIRLMRSNYIQAEVKEPKAGWIAQPKMENILATSKNKRVLRDSEFLHCSDW